MKACPSSRRVRALPTRDSGTTMKTKIASFNGQQFVAERDGDELLIFMVHADPLYSPIMAQDRKVVRTVADLNILNRGLKKQEGRNA